VANSGESQLRCPGASAGGVGSLEETFSTALIRGNNFISIDNVRGALDSPSLESFLTEDTYLARAPHLAAVEIDPRRVILQLTSNKADITPDFANRCSCVRILKQSAGYQFRAYREGDVLDHVRAQQPEYLGAVFAVIRAWHQAGKPKTDETSHDFRPWARTLDWIVQNILGAGPLLDGHRDTQVRMSTPGLNWLRDVALAVRRADALDQWLRTNRILDIMANASVEVPGADEQTDFADDEVRKKALQAIGRRMSKCFEGHNPWVIDGIEIMRQEHVDAELRRSIKEYRFRLVETVEPQCAYSPSSDERIGADQSAKGVDDSVATSDKAALTSDSDGCAYGAPIRAPMAAPNGKAFAPNAPIGHVIPMMEKENKHDIGEEHVFSSAHTKEIEPIGALGAPGADALPNVPAFVVESDLPVLLESDPADAVKWYDGERRADVSDDVARLAERRDGWSPEGWRDRLLQMATCCDEIRPERALELRQAAGLMMPDGSGENGR